LEVGSSGVRVNAICPGSIATDLRRTTEEIIGVRDRGGGLGVAPPEVIRQTVPLGARGVPDDIAQAAVYLASAESDYVTGHALVVDGGWSIH
jgi:NAD(P)-dependent dehydrogenase (short-subunit alcohol dehydrogenase family)